MSYELVLDHTRVNYSPGNRGRLYIVNHYTGNTTDTAAGNANYFRDADRGASANYFVDDNYVYEVVSPDDTAWAVGVDYGGNLFGLCTNFNSISVEMCSVDGVITDKTLENTIELNRYLMNRYDIPADHVVRHYDVCGKRCPGWSGWVQGDETIWQNFKNRLAGENETNNKEEAKIEGREVDMKCFYAIDNKGPVFYFDGQESHPLAHQDEMTAINNVYKACNGKDIPCFSWSSKAPWHVRLLAGVQRKEKEK